MSAAALKARLADPRFLLAPGVADPLTALIAAEAGHQALFLSGAGLSFAQFARPDLGFHGLADLAESTRRITSRCALPLIVDADTGFGNALNVADTVARLEATGAAAIVLEDQTAPKRCGHLAGKSVIPLPEAAGKIAAAVAARRATLIIARTDALAVEGLEPALTRARAYAAAGADLIFVEAPLHRATLSTIATLPAPLVVNMVEAGPPTLSAADVAALGFRIALFPVMALRAQVAAARAALAHLHAAGTPAAAPVPLAPFADLNSLTGLDSLLADADRFKGTS
ncbi:isocitrate lyase/PEP mutase family protein [Sandaracinobacteroides saxicola]|uniref:Isocitrate lyase/phosphoenolpyruvate mutase family protein n=1 Tax=Sandaracinobacteroides saxicola TaxID=2759707 RepID=A0A7G5IED4_9SPHN|nr:isocitrate lyase/phosphoenolpyruvate mutase family protein [Sandaracinobacteroides saxicola]QMW21726.1 isocitrate lyase/phosphoenolpyruvate mutase family protein [Sandaracinobacteroides saxicola]